MSARLEWARLAVHAAFEKTLHRTILQGCGGMLRADALCPLRWIWIDK
jgi:hypothetical protein